MVIFTKMEPDFLAFCTMKKIPKNFKKRLDSRATICYDSKAEFVRVPRV